MGSFEVSGTKDPDEASRALLACLWIFQNKQVLDSSESEGLDKIASAVACRGICQLTY